MTASIQVGLNALLMENSHLEAIAIALCDQPFVSAQILNRLVIHGGTLSGDGNRTR